MAAVTQLSVTAQKTEPISRVVFTQGGKGGTGKTAFATMLVEWYAAHKTPVVLIDMDTENKGKDRWHTSSRRRGKVTFTWRVGSINSWKFWINACRLLWPIWVPAPEKSRMSGLTRCTNRRRKAASPSRR